MECSGYSPLKRYTNSPSTLCANHLESDIVAGIEIIFADGRARRGGLEYNEVVTLRAGYIMICLVTERPNGIEDDGEDGEFTIMSRRACAHLHMTELRVRMYIQSKLSNASHSSAHLTAILCSGDDIGPGPEDESIAAGRIGGERILCRERRFEDAFAE